MSLLECFTTSTTLYESCFKMLDKQFLAEIKISSFDQHRDPTFCGRTKVLKIVILLNHFQACKIILKHKMFYVLSKYKNVSICSHIRAKSLKHLDYHWRDQLELEGDKPGLSTSRAKPRPALLLLLLLLWHV